MLAIQTFGLTLLCAFCTTANSARILGIIPTPAPSHYILFNALMKGLAEAGHNVTVISPFEEKNPPKAGSYRDITLTGVLEKFEVWLKDVDPLDRKNKSLVKVWLWFADLATKMNDNFFAHEKVQQLLKSDETFDVVIVEQLLNDAMKIFGYVYKVPVIVFSTVGANPWTNNIVRNPSPLSYIPQIEDAAVSPLMSFSERLSNVICSVTMQLIDLVFYFPEQNRVVKKYFPDAPDIYDLYYNVSLILLNSHESVNQPVPLVPNMVQIGGFHIKPPKKLPKDLQEFLDNATDGAVYFSMGSNVKSKNLPSHKRDAFLTAFSKLKEKVLWKWEDDDLPGKPPNVKTSKWLPQQDILAHPNVKLFISHSGLLSTTEAVYHGVPILGIPVGVDQHMNANLATLNGYAFSLPYEDPTFSEEKLSQMLHELLTNPKYRDIAKKRSQIFHDRPRKPMDTAVYWVEYVIRTGGAPHLKVAGIRFSWFKYHSLDVISFVIVATSLVVFILYVIIGKILSCWGISCKAKNKSKAD